MSQPAHANDLAELVHVLPLCRELDRLGLRGAATVLADWAGHPYQIGHHVVRKIEHELRCHNRGEPADLGRVVAGTILLALKKPDGSVAP